MHGTSQAPSRAPTARTLKSYGAANGELVGEVPISTADEVRAAVGRARKAQSAWGVLPIEERCTRLVRFRDALVERADEIVDVVMRECGKPRQDALAHEVFITIDLFTWYLDNAARILAPREVALHLFKHKKSVLNYVPRGVVGVIGTWNFPVVIPLSDAIAALVTGSAAVVKPSEETPLSMQKVKDIFDSTGLPEDLLVLVHGGADVGAALIESGIQKLCFTGGVETGRKVAAACGRSLVPSVMELGGKAPLLACSDCDVERTARAIVFGGFVNSGQACISVERVYAHEDVHDALVSRVRELVSELRQGDPTSGDTVELGAIIAARQLEVAERHVADAVSKGAEIIIGGKRRPGGGRFFEPTVLARCDHSMTVMTQEIFGPIVPIQRVASEDEAIALANDSHLGLNAYVFTKDKKKGERLAHRIEAGSVIVNDVLVNYGMPEAPFGGVKQSGYGRIHGDDALRDMAETRHVLTSRIPDGKVDGLFGFPYSAKAYKWQLKMLRALYTSGGVLKKIARLV